MSRVYFIGCTGIGWEEIKKISENACNGNNVNVFSVWQIFSTETACSEWKCIGAWLLRKNICCHLSQLRNGFDLKHVWNGYFWRFEMRIGQNIPISYVMRAWWRRRGRVKFYRTVSNTNNIQKSNTFTIHSIKWKLWLRSDGNGEYEMRDFESYRNRAEKRVNQSQDESIGLCELSFVANACILTARRLRRSTLLHYSNFIMSRESWLALHLLVFRHPSQTHGCINSKIFHIY